MSPQGSLPAAHQRHQSVSTSSFAEILSKARGGSPTQQPLNGESGFDSSFLDPENNPMMSDENMREAQEKRRLTELRRRMQEINPIDQREVFNRRRQQEQMELEQLQQQIKQMIGRQPAPATQPVDQTVSQPVVDVTGIAEPKGMKLFLDKVRQHAQLILQLANNEGAPWATTMSGKSSKKRMSAKGITTYKGKKGSDVGSTFFNTAHHERQASAQGAG